MRRFFDVVAAAVGFREILLFTGSALLGIGVGLAFGSLGFAAAGLPLTYVALFGVI